MLVFPVKIYLRSAVVVETDVDKIDVGAAVVLMVVGSDCLQEGEVKLDLLSY